MSGPSSLVDCLVQGSAYLKAATLVGGSDWGFWNWARRTVFRRFGLARIVESLTTTIQINDITRPHRSTVDLPPTLSGGLNRRHLRDRVLLRPDLLGRRWNHAAGSHNVDPLQIPPAIPAWASRLDPCIRIRLGRTRFNEISLPWDLGNEPRRPTFPVLGKILPREPGRIPDVFLAFSDATRSVAGQISRALPEAAGTKLV